MERKIYHLDIAKLPNEMHIDEYLNKANLTREIIAFITTTNSDYFCTENDQWLFEQILSIIVNHGTEEKRSEYKGEAKAEDSESKS